MQGNLESIKLNFCSNRNKNTGTGDDFATKFTIDQLINRPAMLIITVSLTTECTVTIFPKCYYFYFKIPT